MHSFRNVLLENIKKIFNIFWLTPDPLLADAFLNNGSFFDVLPWKILRSFILKCKLVYCTVKTCPCFSSIPCKKWLIWCTLQYTCAMDKSLFPRYQKKYGHVKLVTLYVIKCIGTVRKRTFSMSLQLLSQVLIKTNILLNMNTEEWEFSKLRWNH